MNLAFAFWFSNLSMFFLSMTSLSHSDMIKVGKTGGVFMAGSIQLELSGAVKLSSKLELDSCTAQISPVPLFSMVAIPDETFSKVQVQLPSYRGSGTYAFTKKNWPIFGGSLPISLINFIFKDGSLLMDGTDSQVEFVVNDDAKSGVVTFKNYRGMQLSKNNLVDRGFVQGTIRWNCP